MNKCTASLIPLALGLMVTACSSSSSQQQNSSQAPVALTAETAPNHDPQLTQQLAEKQQLISTLQGLLGENTAKIAALHQALDKKDQRIAELEKGYIDAETLAQLEQEKQRRLDLEAQYRQLKADNAELVQRIAQLEAQQQAATTKPISESQSAQDSPVLNNNSQVLGSADDFLALNKNFQSLDSAHYALAQKHQALLSENALLERRYANLQAENQYNLERLQSLQSENLKLGGALSDAQSQHQLLWDEIKALRAANGSGLRTAKSDTANGSQGLQTAQNTPVEAPYQELLQKLQQSQDKNINLSEQLKQLQSLNEALEQAVLDYEDQLRELQNQRANDQATSRSRLLALGDEKVQLERAQQLLKAQLEEVQQQFAEQQSELLFSKAQLEASNTELARMTAQLREVEQALQSQQNESISLMAAMDAFAGQLGATLSPIEWQLPNEMALHNTFEVVVSANVEQAVPGQTYTAQLITDSAIKMISAASVDSVVQEGKLQWRWRVSGLNEKPDAKLHLFVSQQMSYQNQALSRQLLSESRSLALTNDDWLEKYGFWAGAILAGLLGGFLIGRLNKRKA